jgi:hypothetical protein
MLANALARFGPTNKNLGGSHRAVFDDVGQIPTENPLPFLHEIRTEAYSGDWCSDL